MEISNRTNNYIYFDKKNHSIIDNMWDFVSESNILFSDFENHFINTQVGIERPDRYLCVIPNIVPIPPKSAWDFSDNEFKLKQGKNINTTFLVDYELNNLLKIINKLLKPYKNKSIAVELSGGLDSSIIISILDVIGLNPFLVGFQSTNFEFRTENLIQNIYRNNFNSVLIDSKKALPFSEITKCPPHPLPSKKSLFYFQKSLIAKECKDKSIDIIFNGSVGDTVFCENFNQLINNKDFNSWQFENNWFNEFIFQPQDLLYVPTNSSFILDYFLKCRINESEDPFKIWARNYFKSILPVELTEYYYKSDYYEEIIEGILNAEDDIKEVYQFTYDFTKNYMFKSSNVKDIIHNVKKINEFELNRFFSDCSYATWIYSLRDIID